MVQVHSVVPHCGWKVRYLTVLISQLKGVRFPHPLPIWADGRVGRRRQTVNLLRKIHRWFKSISVHQTRIWCNGSILVFQTKGTSSNLVIRSICHVSTMVVRMSCKHLIWVQFLYVAPLLFSSTDRILVYETKDTSSILVGGTIPLHSSMDKTTDF